MGERGKERKMLEKRGHYDSEVEANERKMVLEERMRAHVKFLSSGEYVLCFVNPQSLPRAGDCDPGMYTSTFAGTLGQSSLDPNFTDTCKPSFIVKRRLKGPFFSVLELSTKQLSNYSKANCKHVSM